MRKTATFGIILLGSQLALADASYQETSQITGGSLAQALKAVSFLKSVNNIFAPITTTTMVHGNQKVVVSKDSTEITDLDQETITRIDNAHKTYTVTTFAQMRQAVANAQKQIGQAQTQTQPEQQPEQPKSDVQTSFDVSVKNTGATREINGLTAQEQLVTMQMHATDPNAPPSQGGNSVTYVVTTDAWISADPPEVKEVQDFDVRMARQLMTGVDLTGFQSQMTQNPGMGQLFSSRPGSAEAMAEMQKEMAKIHGTRVMEVTRMGGSATGAHGTQSASSSGSSASSAPTPSSDTSAMGMLGSALGGSAFGGFHRKKPAPAAAPAATATDPLQPAMGAVLIEMTMQKSAFSQQAVPASAFVVPAGYKKVESNYGSAAH